MRESGLANSVRSVGLSVPFRRVRVCPNAGSVAHLAGCVLAGAAPGWCPKYRRRIVRGRVTRRCGELVEQIADEHDWQMVAEEVMPDHVHLFARVGPMPAPAQMVRRGEFPQLRRHVKVMVSPSYFAASVGDVSESTVRRDIEHQWDAVAS